MKLRTAAIIVAGVVALGLGVFLYAGHRQHAEAEELLRAAYAEGRQIGFIGQGKIGLLAAGKWVERRARFAQAAGRRRIEGVGGPAGPVLLDDGSTTWRLEPAAQRAVGIGPSEQQRDWKLLLRNYRLRLEGEAQVAGRRAQRVALVPRRQRGAALRLWIDRDTKAALRTDSFDADGHLVARTLLESVDFDRPPAPGGLHVPEAWSQVWMGNAPAKQLTLEEFVKTAGFTPRAPTYVPPGYEDRGLFGRNTWRGKRYAELRYHDGLRALSVFERPPPGAHGRGQGMGRGHGAGPGGGPPPGGGFGPGPGVGWRWGRGWQTDQQPVVIDQGATKSIRQRREDLMVVVTGDLPVPELVRVLISVPEEKAESEEGEDRL